ncbi:hypothetical protein D3C71_1610400 [compost metagenome]
MALPQQRQGILDVAPGKRRQQLLRHLGGDRRHDQPVRGAHCADGLYRDAHAQAGAHLAAQAYHADIKPGARAGLLDLGQLVGGGERIQDGRQPRVEAAVQGQNR